jgi:CRISPR/Cas system-associated exonuclease Cas4 (RecB family)
MIFLYCPTGNQSFKGLGKRRE